MKLPYTTGKNATQTVSRRYTDNGLEGIVNAIRLFASDDKIAGYYPYVMIQPRIMPNNECKIACFNGFAKFKVISVYTIKIDVLYHNFKF